MTTLTAPSTPTNPTHWWAAALTSTLAAALLALASPAAQAQAHVSLQINSGGFQPVGHGYYQDRPSRVWVEGHWVPRSHGPVWVEGHWAYKPRPQYSGHYYQGGYYQRPAPRWDRDGDGVPNRHDRRPNNPWKY
jgi:hypothetical protein